MLKLFILSIATLLIVNTAYADIKSKLLRIFFRGRTTEAAFEIAIPASHVLRSKFVSGLQATRSRALMKSYKIKAAQLVSEDMTLANVKFLNNDRLTISIISRVAPNSREVKSVVHVVTDIKSDKAILEMTEILGKDLEPSVLTGRVTRIEVAVSGENAHLMSRNLEVFSEYIKRKINMDIPKSRHHLRSI